MTETVDKYISSFSGTDKKMLVELRKLINSVSSFDEKIYYHMPAFLYKGKYVAAFKMYARHVGFYPCSGSVLNKFEKELSGFKTSVGAVQLPKGQKFPATLIKKIIIARMKEVDNGKKR